MNHKRTILASLISIALISGCNDSSTSTPEVPEIPEIPELPQAKVPYFQDWPQINSAVEKDDAIESEILSILAQMTLEEKVGQMVQPDLREVTPAEAAEYKLGSLLNGGGGWPDKNKYATAEDWAKESDKYYLAVKAAFEERGFNIPFMWATDAVHGHNNVFRATVFPHNIGLGAANDPELIKRIGAATASEIVATGLDWTFAPTVASPRDYRWGRVYEGYSEDPEIIFQYAGQMVEGLQAGSEGLKGQNNVISNVKHWVGDGGTLHGEDRGANHYTEEYLRNIHATGYFSGLEAGAQVVMSSFNSWHNPANYDLNEGDERPVYNYKLHGSKYLLNDILKGKMGFDGLIVTDWNGQMEIDGCSASNCPEAVNAGNDVFMVTSRNDWQGFYGNVIDQVKDGTIKMSRIDDAVTRILRVKMRANLWEKPQPSMRLNAGNEELLGADSHRAIAREAVSKSLVLLKNEADILPLQKGKQYLIIGSGANSIQKQTGGWSLTWQGTENEIEKDFPGAQTMLLALQEEVGAENVITDPAEATADTIAIVVMGEDPYAEMFGDIKSNKTLEYATLKPSYGADLETIKSLKAEGLKVVSVFYSGRPLYVNEEVNHSDAFIAAWLPGTEAGGITDVLFNKKGMDFTGRLSYSWPKLKCSTTINRHAPNITDYITPVDGITGDLIEQDIEGEHKPLFPYGYGLSYDENSAEMASESDLSKLPLDPRDFGCGQNEPDNGVSTTNLEIFGRDSGGEFIARMGGNTTGWAPVDVSNGEETSMETLITTPIDYKHQQDALNVNFTGGGASQLYMQTEDEKGIDKNAYLNAESTLQFDIDMKTQAPESFVLSMHCEWPCLGEVNIANVLPAPLENTEIANWQTFKIPLSCFAEEGLEFSMLNTAFLMFSDSTTPIEFNLGEVRFVPKSVDAAEDAITCEELKGEVLPPLTDSRYDVLADFNAELDINDQYTTDGWGPIPDGDTHLSASIDMDTVNVSYNQASPESYKGHAKLFFAEQNMSEFVGNGALVFELYVESLGSQRPEDDETGLVMKVGNSDGDTGDIFVDELNGANLVIGEWVSVSIPMSLIEEQGSNAFFAETINRVEIFPAWANTQAGVAFQMKDVRFNK